MSTASSLTNTKFSQEVQRQNLRLKTCYINTTALLVTNFSMLRKHVNYYALPTDEEACIVLKNTMALAFHFINEWSMEMGDTLIYSCG